MPRNECDPQQASQTPQIDNTLANDIEDFVKVLLKGYKPQKITEPKVIHDPILGSNVFEPYEIALIDSPFVQRLRRISQTDVASLVYPSANHNRLEHSLSVATIAGRILANLSRPSDPDNKRILRILTDVAKMEVRFASILHDIGHGVFSHLSEDVIKSFPEVELHRSQNPGKFDPDKPHEMIAYLLIKSPSFNNYFEDYIVKQYGLSGEISLDRIANSIIQSGGKDEFYGWQADIINGPFDADKFDYLQRDAYFSGLKIGVDLDRFLHCVWLESRPGLNRQLKIMKSGAVTLEQILFGKLMLYNTIYHHQKIRAAECAVKGIFELIFEKQKTMKYEVHSRSLKRAIDFLYITESDILSLGNESDELGLYVSRFLNRQLFKRALVISADTVINPEESPGYQKFKALVEKPEELRALAIDLVKDLDGKYSIHDIWIDLPQTQNFKDALFARIQDKGDEGVEPTYLQDTFRVGEWLTAYGSNKWKGYVFCPARSDCRNEVGNKAAELISNRYKFKFNIEKALGQAKIR